MAASEEQVKRDQVKRLQIRLLQRQLTQQPPEDSFGRGVASGFTSVLDSVSTGVDAVGRRALPGAPRLGDPSLRSAVDRVISLDSQGPLTRAGEAVGRGVAVLPAAAIGGPRAIATDLVLSALGGVAAGVVTEAGGGEQAADVAELTATLAPLPLAGLVRFMFRGPSNEAAALAAAQQQITGVQPGLLAADSTLTGRLALGGSQRFPGGEGPIIAANERISEELLKSITTITRDVSKISDKFVAGAKLSASIDDIAQNINDRMTALVNNIGISDDLPGGIESLSDTLQALAGRGTGVPELDRLATTPVTRSAAGQVPLLQEAGFTLTWEQARHLRSMVGNKLSNAGLISDVPRGDLKRIYAALSEDMSEAVRSGGQDALQKWNQANRFWRRGQDALDESLQAIADKVEPGNIIDTVVRSPITLARIRKQSTPQQWDMVVSSAFSEMGMVIPSQQNAAGTIWSLDTFLTQWRRMPEKSRQVLLGGPRYKETKEKLTALSQQAERFRAVRQQTDNPSKTARAGVQVAATSALAAGIFTGNLLAVGGVIGASLSANVTGRMMSNPRFLDWLAESTQVAPQDLARHGIRLLPLIQESSPDVATELAALAIGLSEQQAFAQPIEGTR